MKTGAQIAGELAGRVSLATDICRDEPMAKHTTLRIGGSADVYVEPASEADLVSVVKFCHECRLPFFVIGRGSNLLVRDGGFRGVAICLAQPNFSRIEVAGERLHCGAGAKLKNVAAEAKRNSLSGVEFLEGIPGSVGGALRMNAGAMGGATFNVIESVRFMDHTGKIQERSRAGMPVEYRCCRAAERSHCAGRGIPVPAGAARGNRKANEGVQRETLGLATRRAECRLHVQKSGNDLSGQID